MSWLADRIRWAHAPWTYLSSIQVDLATIRLAALEIPTRFNRLERLLMATAEDLAARIDSATNEVASDLKAVRDELAAVSAAAETDKQAAVDAALAKLDAPIARLEALGADPSDPIPTPEPTPEPAPPADPAA
jgi:hypothetical protein